MLVALVDGVAALAKQTGQRGRCPGCGSEVMSKCGAVLANHWSHIGDNCGHESDIHLALKLLFAYPSGACEVSPKGINRRADVLYGRTVYEIQHSPIDDRVVRAREDDWTAAGYEVVWVIDGDAGITVASSNVVRVRLLPDYRLTMWCKGVEPETFDPMRLGRTASAMATDMLLRSARAAAWSAKVRAEQAKAEEEQANERRRQAQAQEQEANERRRQAQDAAKRAQWDAADAKRAASISREEIDGAKWDRKAAEKALQEARHQAELAAGSKKVAYIRACMDWIYRQTGARNLEMLRRIARGDRGAAAVVAAIDQRTPEAVREALGDGTVEQALRRVADTCMVSANLGKDGRSYCCRVYSGQIGTFEDVAEALLWCVEGLPAGAGLED